MANAGGRPAYTAHAMVLAVGDRMRSDRISLVDERGQPLSARVHNVLADLVPRLQRQFPGLNDACAMTEVLEEVARKIAGREQRGGPLRELHTYAWVIARRTAAARLRASSSVVARATVASDKSGAVLAATPSRVGTSDQIEAEVLLHEVMARLTVPERVVCRLKLRGWSTKEIAVRQGTSVASVNSLFYRLGQRLRNLAGGGAPDGKRDIRKMRRR